MFAVLTTYGSDGHASMYATMASLNWTHVFVCSDWLICLFLDSLQSPSFTKRRNEFSHYNTVAMPQTEVCVHSLNLTDFPALTMQMHSDSGYLVTSPVWSTRRPLYQCFQTYTTVKQRVTQYRITMFSLFRSLLSGGRIVVRGVFDVGWPCSCSARGE